MHLKNVDDFQKPLEAGRSHGGLDWPEVPDSVTWRYSCLFAFYSRQLPIGALHSLCSLSTLCASPWCLEH